MRSVPRRRGDRRRGQDCSHFWSARDGTECSSHGDGLSRGTARDAVADARAWRDAVRDAIRGRRLPRRSTGKTATGLRGIRASRPTRSSKSSSWPPGCRSWAAMRAARGSQPTAGEVLAQQVSCSRSVAGGGGADHLDVVAFQFICGRPGSWPAVAATASRSAIASPKAGSALTARRSAVSPGGQSGSLCLAVERGGPPVCGDHTAVVFDRRPGIVQAIMVAAGLAVGWLHDRQVAWVA